MAEVKLLTQSEVDENGPAITKDRVLYETYSSIHRKNLELAGRTEEWYRKKGIKIGKIAAPARGSWILASDFTEWFDVKNDHILPFSVQSYSGMQQAEPGQLVIAKTMPTREEIEGINFLLLDEVWESGYTANFIARYLKIMGAASVCVSTLYFKPGHNMITDTEPNRPDIHVAETEAWVDFPGERARRLRKPTHDLSVRTHDRIVIWPDKHLADLEKLAQSA